MFLLDESLFKPLERRAWCEKEEVLQKFSPPELN